MAMGIGIGMGISGTQQGIPLATGYFAVDDGCAFALPFNPYTELLESVPYKTGDYIETRIAGPYGGKRILLGTLVYMEPLGANLVAIEGGSLVYNACQT